MVAATVLLANSLGAAVVPRLAPEFTIELPDRKTVQLSQYRGKVVALEFILTSCSHCQETAQLLQKLQNEFGPQGFQALGVAVNDNAFATLPDFIRVLKLEFPVGIGPRDSAVEFLQHPIMMTMMMPQLVVIDRTGQIRAQYAGNDPAMLKDKAANIRALLKKLLTGAGPTAKPATTKKGAS